jgi:hypothetical protein
MTVTTNVPTDSVEIVERPSEDFWYQVFVHNIQQAGFIYFLDACAYANTLIGVEPVGSPRSGWAKELTRDLSGNEFWTYEA